MHVEYTRISLVEPFTRLYAIKTKQTSILNFINELRFDKRYMYTKARNDGTTVYY